MSRSAPAKRAFWSLLIAGVMLGCVQADMPEAAEGRTLFLDNCAVCHGLSGQGDGAMAGVLDPAPADLTTISTRGGGAFPKARVLSVIDGYTRMQRTGPDMPEFGLLLLGDTVPVDTLSL
ncbi:MAG: cytochrome c, partial [Marinosulfonomonas sp.]|nr:cytochrome c [Marinosulfonomonas sp.]